MFNVLQGPTIKERNFVLRKEKIEHANENELFHSSSRVVLEVNEREIFFFTKN